MALFPRLIFKIPPLPVSSDHKTFLRHFICTVQQNMQMGDIVRKTGYKGKKAQIANMRITMAGTALPLVLPSGTVGSREVCRRG
jgi:hypothetical protein